MRVSHEELRPDSVMDSLDTREAGTPGTVVLKFEPFVLHVQCRDVDTARRMCACAVEAGFRNSGITWGRAGKLVMAVRSTHGLEVPHRFRQSALLKVEAHVVGHALLLEFLPRLPRLLLCHLALLEMRREDLVD